MAMLERTQLSYTEISFETVSGQASYDIVTSGMSPYGEDNADFIDSRFITAKIGSYVLTMTDWQSISRLYTFNNSSPTVATGPNGLPHIIAFYNHVYAYLCPIPNSVLKVDVIYKAPLVSWTPGDSGAASLDINMPQEAAADCCIYGASYELESSNQEMVGSTQIKGKKWEERLNYWASRSTIQTGVRLNPTSIWWASVNGYYPGTPLPGFPAW